MLHTSLFVVACVVQNLDMLVFISCNCDAFSTICCNERGIVAYIELFAMWSHLRRCNICLIVYASGDTCYV